MKAKLIRIDREHAASGVYSSSLDMTGLVASGKDRDEVLAKLPEVIELTFKALGEDVMALRCEQVGARLHGAWCASEIFAVIPRGAHHANSDL